MIEMAPRLPPHSIEAEQSVLGAILLDNRAMATASSVLVTAHFYRAAHQRIFQTMLD